jgi:hypothetical protein
VIHAVKFAGKTWYFDEKADADKVVEMGGHLLNSWESRVPKLKRVTVSYKRREYHTGVQLDYNWPFQTQEQALAALDTLGLMTDEEMAVLVRDGKYESPDVPFVPPGEPRVGYKLKVSLTKVWE